MIDIWQQTLNIIAGKINQESFDTWFSPTSLLTFDDICIEVAVPNLLYYNWLSEHYLSLIKESLYCLVSHDIKIKFTISNKNIDNLTSQNINLMQEINNKEKKFTSGYVYETANLNPRYTFSNFVIGASNQFAHAACLAVSDQPGRAYNPLFIYGGVGLGKTHILHAIGHQILIKNPMAKICYVFAEAFMNELVNAIRFDRMPRFRDKYRYMDVLLIDDIQFITGKERTQEEFFHTFNALHEARKQIVITSDNPPREIPTIEERLRSRFEWGLIADIQPPDLETKLAIIRKKSEKENISLPDEVAMLIASSINSNIRELEGSLNRVIAYSAIHGEEITLSLSKNILKDIIKEKEKLITVERIQEKVAKHFDITINDLKSRTRTASLALQRQIAMYLCKTLTSQSLPYIGRCFGGKDHTTVLHAYNKILKNIETDNHLKSQINYLIDNIQNT